MNQTNTPKQLPCNELPDNCNFLLKDFQKGNLLQYGEGNELHRILPGREGTTDEAACSVKKRCTAVKSCSCPVWLTAKGRYWKIPVR